MDEVKLFVPGRIGLIGEISDLVSPYLAQNKDLIPGHAISVRIDKGIYSKAKLSDKFKYSSKMQKFECEISEKALKKEAENNTFFSYMCGTILYLIRNYEVAGLEIEIEKMDLPIQKGLSSSAAICMTIAKAYNQLYHLKLSDQEIKNIAYQGEHLAQSQCGKLDQESIENKVISHIIFEKDEVHSEELFVKEKVFILVVDLNGNKNTKAIMDCFNAALPFAQKEEEKAIHDIIGSKNKELVEMAIEGLKNGNLEQLGKALNQAQDLMDRASGLCSELKAPILHQLLQDKQIKDFIYGGKSSGSGGDGTAVLICKNEQKQQELAKYIENKFDMKSIKFTIPQTSKKKVTIIGAGPAGLAAAYHLLKNDTSYDVTILEQDSKIRRNI